LGTPQQSIPLRFIFYAIVGRSLTLHMRRAVCVVRPGQGAACAQVVIERRCCPISGAMDFHFPMAGEAKRDGISVDFDAGDWLVNLQVGVSLGLG